MSKIGVSFKIDVTKIDKKRLFKGKKGTYLDATIFIDTNQQDQYGHNGFLSQDVSKEEKESGVKGNILGNAKVFWSDSGTSNGQSAQSSQPAPASGGNFDDIPFAKVDGRYA